MSKIVYGSIVLILFVNVCLGQIAYQEDRESDLKKSNAAGRLPLFAPTRCKQNELLYPGDQADDWICDCAPANLYYPETDECYNAFRQGPCEAEKILVLGQHKIIPECIANPCKIDGQIPISKICYQLNKVGPCKDAHLSYVLGVDPKTLQVDCVKLSVSLENRLGDNDENTVNYNFNEVELCSRGTKRAIQGRCPA